MIRKNDLILVGIVVLLVVGIFAFMNITKKEGSQVVVTIGGEVYKTFPLDEDTTFTLDGEHGETNTFVIKDGYVDMTEANCPDKVCVKHARIHYNNETIVCLPNKVVLEITDGEDSDVDIIAQ